MTSEITIHYWVSWPECDYLKWTHEESSLEVEKRSLAEFTLDEVVKEMVGYVATTVPTLSEVRFEYGFGPEIVSAPYGFEETFELEDRLTPLIKKYVGEIRLEEK